MIEAIRNVFSIPELKKKILATLGLLAVYRIGFSIPIPGLDMNSFLNRAGGGGGAIEKLLGAISGGAMASGAIFSLGIMPYISSSIIFSLLQKVVPALEEMAKEGESGQKRINQYSRYVTVLLCIVQSLLVFNFIQGPIEADGTGGLIATIDWQFRLIATLSLTAGTIFVMWIGEQITEKGIGNGISMLIMAGIVARMPSALGNIVGEHFGDSKSATYDPAWGTVVLIGLAVAFALIVAGVVYITQGQRRIPVQHAKHVRGRRMAGGTRSYLPLKVNQAGVMPVIFASPLLMFLGMALGWIAAVAGGDSSFLNGIKDQFAPGQTTFLYGVFLVGLIFFFSYFWTGLYFNPEEQAKNIKEYGSFIPGIRPGKRTAEYMQKIVNRITLAGAAFLAVIVLLPTIIFAMTGVTRYVTSFLGGTGLLIIVGVALDLVQTMESHLLMRHYDGFAGPGAGPIRGRRAR